MENLTKRSSIMMLAGPVVALIFSFISMVKYSAEMLGVEINMQCSFLRTTAEGGYGGETESESQWLWKVHDESLNGTLVLIAFILIIATIVLAVAVAFVPNIPKIAVAGTSVLAILMIILNYGKYADMCKGVKAAAEYAGDLSGGSPWTLIVMMIGLAVSAVGAVMAFINKD